MKFKLEAAEESELAALVEQLGVWVRELEEFDLSGYDPLLVPVGEGVDADEQPADH